MENKKILLKNIEVPTGNICIMKGEKGKLEFLSIGDYGKEKNIKADFLGLKEEIHGVPNGVIMPLTKKWVITISTQYGCSMNCTFCDVPKVGKGLNATYHDMLNQIIQGLNLHPEIESTDRLNIHFARMGEPTFNGNVLDVAMCLKRNIYDFWHGTEMRTGTIHPVVSTMMPINNKHLFKFIDIWCNDIKNGYYNGEAGLQLSINSTNEEQRKKMFSNNSLSLENISQLMSTMPDPIGRKYTLNFALADNYELDSKKLYKLFSPDRFIVKITPIHLTSSCIENKIETTGGYSEYHPYKQAETELKLLGYDVLIFIPSKDEDESLITCGNAILSGNMPKTKYKEIK